MLELRDNLTIHDAAYMALAEAMDATCSPATADSPGHQDPVPTEILQPTP
jgi:predicted nucleic acid-binding protein